MEIVFLVIQAGGFLFYIAVTDAAATFHTELCDH
jgi:hypothetical protein